MNLIIDIGNTHAKVALFEDNLLKSIAYFTTSDFIAAFSKQFPLTNINKCIISSVAGNADELYSFIGRKISTIITFSAQSIIPIKNNYTTATTLGNDRLPSVIAASSEFPATDILVIDAGTCVKYNFINKNGEFVGGAISPGLQMRFKALHNFTSRLPLITADEEYDQLIGTNTKESILSGVQNGIIAETDTMITMYKEKYPLIKLFLTGGDADFFAKRLKNRIFVDPYLVLKGLNNILELNTAA